MKHGTKRPNPVRTNIPPPATTLFVAKRIFSIPNPQIPGAFINVLERKGHTYKNPQNLVRVRGKSQLRVAKTARAHQRIELFDRDCQRRGIPTWQSCRRERDQVMTQWRAK